MAEAVLDASAILAVILKEPVHREVVPFMDGGLVSTVNLAEVVAKLGEFGSTEPESRALVQGTGLVFVPFDPEDAWAAGLLRRRTRSERLSLGDRACLALAFSRRIPAVTTDRAWGRLGFGAAVRVVRR